MTPFSIKILAMSLNEHKPEDEPEFAVARVTDAFVNINGDGSQSLEVKINVAGNSADAVEHLASHLRNGASALGAEMKGGDSKNRTSKSYAINSWENSNWQPSGDAWKRN